MKTTLTKAMKSGATVYIHLRNGGLIVGTVFDISGGQSNVETLAGSVFAIRNENVKYVEE
jgi:hypothetical protein